ncbi:MAG: lambda phage CII family protein [Gammaproteobacteria bacterium]|nr:lambda phage CII family protein [Gammaproteobacteria bacterium]
MSTGLQAAAILDQGRSRGRKNFQAILKRLTSRTARQTAEALGIDESTLSRIRSDGRLEQLAELLAVLGLKCVDESKTCYAPDEIARLHYYAVRGVQLPPLADDDPE